jgi:predicted porin
VPKSSQRHTAQISARARIANSLQAKAEYIHREFDDPAYNTDPDSSDEARISLTWLPTPKLSTLLSYDMTTESRDDLHFADTEEPDDRDVRKNFVMGSMTYQVLENLSLTSSYAYIYYRVEQDIEYHDAGGASHTDEDVTSKNKAQSYALDIHYLPHERIALSTGINHTRGRSSFSPNADALLAPEPVSIYSKMRTKETEYNASCDLKLRNNYSSSISYRYAKLDDDIENIYDDIEDGDYHSILVTLSKSW